MPIINIASNDAETFPDGSYCPIGIHNTDADRKRWLSGDCLRGRNGMPSGPIVLYRTHHGLCLKIREANYYDDSDFFMLVWNPQTNAAEEIQYATTRGWCEPCFGSSVDATPEVRTAYEAWREKRAAADREIRRKAECERLRTLCRVMHTAAQTHDVTYLSLRNLRRASPLQFSMAMRLLTATRPLGNFKQSVRERLCDWLRNPAPQYPTPFSRNMLPHLPFYKGPGADTIRA